jgi:hypothetical protein
MDLTSFAFTPKPDRPFMTADWLTSEEERPTMPIPRQLHTYGVYRDGRPVGMRCGTNATEAADRASRGWQSSPGQTWRAVPWSKVPAADRAEMIRVEEEETAELLAG